MLVGGSGAVQLGSRLRGLFLCPFLPALRCSLALPQRGDLLGEHDAHLLTSFRYPLFHLGVSLCLELFDAGLGRPELSVLVLELHQFGHARPGLHVVLLDGVGQFLQSRQRRFNTFNGALHGCLQHSTLARRACM